MTRPLGWALLSGWRLLLTAGGLVSPVKHGVQHVCRSVGMGGSVCAPAVPVKGRKAVTHPLVGSLAGTHGLEHKEPLEVAFDRLHMQKGRSLLSQVMWVVSPHGEPQFLASPQCDVKNPGGSASLNQTALGDIAHLDISGVTLPASTAPEALHWSLLLTTLGGQSLATDSSQRFSTTGVRVPKFPRFFQRPVRR